MPGSCIGTSFWRTDHPKPADGQLSSGQIRPITPGFFKTLRIQQVSGRDFSRSDSVDSTPVAIISDALTREHFPDGSPIGRRLRINIEHANGKSDVEWTIVGVVSSIKSSLDGPVRQTIYVPTTQYAVRELRFFVRTAEDPMLLAPSVEGLVRSREPGVPVEIRTLEDIVSRTITQPRAMSILVSVFALVALVLAAVGVYGVMAYSVRERTQEIGVRIALGATAMSVFRLVIGQALRLVGLGVVAGLICASLVTRLLDRLLFQVAPFDPWTFAATAIVLAAVAIVASYVPARRGMRMAPGEALRNS
jgi:putative ABC transport system permease protein